MLSGSSHGWLWWWRSCAWVLGLKKRSEREQANPPWLYHGSKRDKTHADNLRWNLRRQPPRETHRKNHKKKKKKHHQSRRHHTNLKTHHSDLADNHATTLINKPTTLISTSPFHHTDQQHWPWPMPPPPPHQRNFYATPTSVATTTTWGCGFEKR